MTTSRYFTPAAYETDEEGARRQISPEVVHWDQIHADLSEMCGIVAKQMLTPGTMALTPPLQAARALVAERAEAMFLEWQKATGRT